MEDFRVFFSSQLDEVRRLPREVGALLGGGDAAVDGVDPIVGDEFVCRVGGVSPILSLSLLASDRVDVVEADATWAANVPKSCCVCPVSKTASADAEDFGRTPLQFGKSLVGAIDTHV